MTRWLAPLVLLVAGLPACGEAPKLGEPMTLSADTPELRETLIAADARWEAAGVDPDHIRIGAGGIHVGWQPTDEAMWDHCHAPPDSPPLGGCVEIDVYPPTVRNVWFYAGDTEAQLALAAPHELGHLLGVRFHLEGEGAGIMLENGKGPITSRVLELVCEHDDCSTFSPEAP